MGRKEFAKVVWRTEDVREFRPRWGLKRCEAFLARNERRIQYRMSVRGLEAIQGCLDYEDAEAKAKA